MLKYFVNFLASTKILTSVIFTLYRRGKSHLRVSKKKIYLTTQNTLKILWHQQKIPGWSFLPYMWAEKVAGERKKNIL